MNFDPTPIGSQVQCYPIQNYDMRGTMVQLWMKICTVLQLHVTQVVHLDKVNRPYLERVASLSVYHCFPGGPSDQILDLFGPVLDAERKPECPEKNLWKQVWTGNQMHMSAGTRVKPGTRWCKAREDTLR